MNYYYHYVYEAGSSVLNKTHTNEQLVATSGYAGEWKDKNTGAQEKIDTDNIRRTRKYTIPDDRWHSGKSKCGKPSKP